MLDNLKLPDIPDETKNKIYDDGFHPTVSETGKLLGRIPRAINAAFSSIDCWILQRENRVAETMELLEQNLQNSDPAKIIPPEPYVAIPAIQAISYSMDSDELRKLYANLLAKSIYVDTKNLVHPAYTEVIKNLSPLDCQIFNEIMSSPNQEIGCYEMRVGNFGESSYFVIFPYITKITIAENQIIAASIDNLTRNNLISPKDFHYDDDNMYLPIRETPLYKAIERGYSSQQTELRPYKMSIKSTSFGKLFYNVCCKPL